MFPQNKNVIMKQEEIKIRVSSKLKNDFQHICEFEETTMSNKINTFIVSEVKDKNSILTTTKKLVKLDVINSAGRMYCKSEILKTVLDVDGFEITEIERINKQPLYGQFGHPGDAEKIHKYNATHATTNIRVEDDWLVGDVTILNPSILPVLDNLIFRLRGTGEINKDGIVENLEIIGFDAILKTEDYY